MRRLLVILGLTIAAITLVVLDPSILDPPNDSGRDAIPQVTVPKGFPIGISFGDRLRRVSNHELASALDDVVTLNANWIRIDISWAEVQPTSPSAYDWIAIDRIVAEARARHLKVLGILTYSPAWARAPGCESFTCPPRLDSDFATFARAAAERYGPNKIAAFEIWNEPNIPQFWTSPDATAYRDLLAATIESIRSVDASATLLFGGLAANAAGVGVIVAPTFLADVCGTGVCSRLDGIGYHPFTFPLTAFDKRPIPTAWQRMTESSACCESVRDILSDVRLSRKKIWVTEYGAPTTGDVTEHAQARIVSSGVTAAVSSADQIGAVFIYTWKDLGAGDSFEDHFGLRRLDGSRKPAFRAMARAAARG